MDKYLNEIIDEGKSIIRKSLNHHLPLPFRNKLLKIINNKKMISRLSILCALKVYPLWEKQNPDNPDLLLLLQKAEIYANTQKNEDELLQLADKMQTYVLDSNDEEHFTVLFAGFSAVNAAYEVTGKNIDETVRDDSEIDSHDWDSAFFACLAYNDGAPSLSNVDNNKTKEFWEWYLNEGLKKAFSTEKLVFVKEATKIENKEFKRDSLSKILNDKKIKIEIDKISNILIKNIALDNWDEISYVAYFVDRTSMSDFHSIHNSEKKRIAIRYEVRETVDNIAKSIKDMVYKIAPEEGTFYSFQFIINNKKEGKVNFIYDIQDKNLKDVFFEKDFVNDFKKYPRKIEYTPIWLQKILKKEKGNLYL